MAAKIFGSVSTSDVKLLSAFLKMDINAPVPQLSCLHIPTITINAVLRSFEASIINAANLTLFFAETLKSVKSIKCPMTSLIRDGSHLLNKLKVSNV